MPRPKKAKAKTARNNGPEKPNGNGAESSVATAVAEPPVEELQPPATPVEPAESERGGDEKAAPNKDHIAASLNIAKLQAMSMGDLNQMARDLSVENFGTMRKHEVI